MKNSNAKRQAKKITAHTVTYICSAVIAVFFVFPLIWMIVTSTKTELQYANDLGSFNTFLPYLKDLSTFFDNYKSVLTQYDIWKYALNSFGYALAVVAGNILVNALAGSVSADGKRRALKLLNAYFRAKTDAEVKALNEYIAMLSAGE